MQQKEILAQMYLKCVWDFTLDHQVYAHAMSPIARNHSLIASMSHRPVKTTYDDHLVAGSLDPKIRLCDIQSGGSAQMLVGHRDAVLAVAWSPVEEYVLASAGRDQSILLWDIRKAGPKQCLAQLDQFKSDAVEAQKAIPFAPSVIAHEGAINSLCFTDDGRRLISAGHDQRIRLWDAQTYHNTMVCRVEDGLLP